MCVGTESPSERNQLRGEFLGDSKTDATAFEASEPMPLSRDKLPAANEARVCVVHARRAPLRLGVSKVHVPFPEATEDWD